MMDTLSIKVPKTKKAKLREVANARKTSLSSLMHAALDRVIEEAKPESGADKLFSKNKCLAELLAGIEPANIHAETDWGKPVGNEI